MSKHHVLRTNNLEGFGDSSESQTTWRKRGRFLVTQLVLWDVNVPFHHEMHGREINLIFKGQGGGRKG